MARRRKGASVNGWLALDKPAGLTSTQALARVRRLFDARKAGQGGTLESAGGNCLAGGARDVHPALAVIDDSRHGVSRTPPCTLITS